MIQIAPPGRKTGGLGERLLRILDDGEDAAHDHDIERSAAKSSCSALICRGASVVVRPSFP
jgi:hypothetical protein